MEKQDNEFSSRNGTSQMVEEERQEFCLNHFAMNSIALSPRVLPIAYDDDDDEDDDACEVADNRRRPAFLRQNRNAAVISCEPIHDDDMDSAGVKKFIRQRPANIPSWTLPATTSLSPRTTSPRRSKPSLRRSLAWSQDSQDDHRVTKRMRLCDSRDDDDDDRHQQVSWKATTSLTSNSILVTPPRPTFIHWDDEISNAMDLSHLLDLAIETSMDTASSSQARPELKKIMKHAN